MSDTNVKKLCSLYFCEWLLDVGDANLLSLGDAFDKRISKIIAFKGTVSKEIGMLPEDRLARLVNSSPKEQNDTYQAEALEDDKRFRELAKAAPAEVSNSRNQSFVIWALGLRPGVFADFQYWEKFDEFSLNELVWLSTGLTPQNASTEKELERVARTHIFPLGEISRRRNLIIRAFSKAHYRNIEALEFKDWMSRVGFSAHPLFHGMIEVAALRSNHLKPTSSLENPSDSFERLMQPREFRTAARIITAMAIDVYGHVPNQKRNKSTKDILDACDKAGLSVSNDTILKFLRAGDGQVDD
jgi:hypothetical protein